MKALLSFLLFVIFCFPLSGQVEWSGFSLGNQVGYSDESFNCDFILDFQDYTYNSNPFTDNYCTSVNSSGLSSLEMESIHITPEGDVLIGTRSGFSVLTDNQFWETFTFKTSALPEPNSVEAVFKDSQGLIWASSETGGIFSWDGTDWKIYDSAPGNTFPPTAYDFEEDFLGDIWAAGDFGIGRWDRSTDQWFFYNYTNGPLPFGTYLDLTFDQDYNLWVAHLYDGLVFFNSGTFQATQYESNTSGLPSDFVTAVHFNEDQIGLNDTVWYSTADQGFGFLQIETLDWTNFNANDFPNWGNNQITDMIRIESRNETWLSTPTGNVMYDGNNFKTFQPSMGNHFALNNTDIAYDPTREQIWTLSSNQGPGVKFLWSDGFLQRDQQNNGSIHSNSFKRLALSPSDEVWVIGRDNPGHIGVNRSGSWLLNMGFREQSLRTITNDITFSGDFAYLATDEGFWKFDWRVFSNWEHFSNNGDLDQINVIEADLNGNIWLGTQDNGLFRFDGQQFTEYNTFNSGLPDDRINALAVQPDGKVWIGTHTAGLASFDGSTWEIINETDGLPDNEVWGLSFDPVSQSIGVATNAGIAVFSPTGNNTNYPPMSSSPLGSRFRSIAIDPDGTIYAGSLAGFGVLEGADWDLYTPDNAALGSTFINDLVIDQEGNKWMVDFSSDRGGLYRFNDGGPGIDPGMVQTIQGIVYEDQNNNGVYEPNLGEKPIPNALLEQRRTISPNMDEIMYNFSNSNGEYRFFLTEPDTYSYRVYPGAGQVETETPAAPFVLDFNNPVDNPLQYSNFGLGAQTIGNADLLLDLHVAKIRCNELIKVDIKVRNVGDQTMTFGDLFLNFPDNLTSFQAAGNDIPFSISSDNAQWFVENLQPGETWINTAFLAGIPETETGTEQGFSIEILDTNNEGWSSNTANQLGTVFCGVDPNDKLVSPEGDGPDNLTKIDTTLTYTIRFQNTGNDYAETVVIRDTLDPNLDIESFQFINSSHPAILNWEASNVISFSFPGIFLPDSATSWAASQGFVRFQIKALPGVDELTIIENNAAIYFDQNAPIITNTVFNTLSSLSTSLENAPPQLSFQAFPNPTDRQLKLEWNQQHQNVSLRLYNILGESIFLKREITQNQWNINTSNLEAGVYFIEWSSGIYRQTEKVIIQHP